MTTKLIQELVGLAVEKSSTDNVIRLLIEGYGDISQITVYAIRFKQSAWVSPKGGSGELEELIAKVKEL